MEEMSFYDVGKKKKFKTVEYKILSKKGKKFAVANSLNGKYQCWRILGKE